MILFVFFRVCRSGEVAPRATSLGPEPSLSFCSFALLFVLGFFCLETKVCFPMKNEGISVNFSVSLFVSP